MWWYDQETISIRTVLLAMEDNSKQFSDNSIDHTKLRDTWKFIYFIGSSKLPGSIVGHQIPVKSIIDENKNFHCDRFMQFLLDEYKKVQPFDVDIGDVRSEDGRDQWPPTDGK